MGLLQVVAAVNIGRVQSMVCNPIHWGLALALLAQEFTEDIVQWAFPSAASKTNSYNHVFH